MPEKILILGGTSDARRLADILEAEANFDVTTSLAGRTEAPLTPAGNVRMGGFGGPSALAAYLAVNEFTLAIDATHPYAAQISENMAKACAVSGVRCFRLERPGWYPQVGDQWITANSPEEAAALIPKGSNVLLTIGRQEIAPFVDRLDIYVLARMIERPDKPPLAPHRIMQARPPFAFEDEELLMRTEHISHLVTKNSGGTMMAPKIEAARSLRLPVVMIERPELPEMETARNVEQALAVIGRMAG